MPPFNTFLVPYPLVGRAKRTPHFQNPFMNGMLQGLSGFTLFLALVLLIPAPISFFNTSRKKRLLDSQTKLIDRTVLIHDAKSVDPLQSFDPPVRGLGGAFYSFLMGRRADGPMSARVLHPV